MPNPTKNLAEKAQELQSSIQEMTARVDRENKGFIEESDLQTSIIYNHGFFPKEIVRFLATRLRENKIPCEIGFDKDLALSGSPEAKQLKDSFRDPRPYYFLAFPAEHIKKAREIMASTHYPIPDQVESEQAAEAVLQRRRDAKEAANFKRLLVYLMYMGVGGGFLYLFYVMAKSML